MRTERPLHSIQAVPVRGCGIAECVGASRRLGVGVHWTRPNLWRGMADVAATYAGVKSNETGSCDGGLIDRVHSA